MSTIEQGREMIVQSAGFIRRNITETTDQRMFNPQTSGPRISLSHLMREHSLGTSSIRSSLPSPPSTPSVSLREFRESNIADEEYIFSSARIIATNLGRLVYGDTDSVILQIDPDTLAFRMLMDMLSSYIRPKRRSNSIPSVRTAFPLTAQEIYILHNNIPSSIKCFKRGIRLAKIYWKTVTLPIPLSPILPMTTYLSTFQKSYWENIEATMTILSLLTPILQKLYCGAIPILDTLVNSVNEVNGVNEYILYKLRKEIIRLDRTYIDEIGTYEYNYDKLKALLKDRTYCGLCCNYKKRMMFVHDEMHEKVCIRCFSKLENGCPFCRKEI